MDLIGMVTRLTQDKRELEAKLDGVTARLKAVQTALGGTRTNPKAPTRRALYAARTTSTTILAALNGEPQTVAELAEKLGVKKSTLTVSMVKLHRDGRVARQRVVRPNNISPIYGYTSASVPDYASVS